MTSSQNAATAAQAKGGSCQPPKYASHKKSAVPTKYGTCCVWAMPAMRPYSHSASKTISPQNAAHRPLPAANSISSMSGINTKAVRMRCFNITLYPKKSAGCFLRRALLFDR